MADEWQEIAVPFQQAVAEQSGTWEAAQQNMEKAWGNIMDVFKGLIPQDYGWNWGPVMLAFCENSPTLKYGDAIYPAVNIPTQSYTSPGFSAISALDGHYIDPDQIDTTRLVPKRWGTQGGLDYVWYVPEWSHPNFNPNVTVAYNKLPRLNYAVDPLSKMRPALRPVDLARDPTEWAKRWGIHPEELGGRSRLSPTLSQSRDPFSDYANQISMLTEEGRQAAIAASRDAARAAGQGANYIAPEVMEELLTKDGKMSGKQLRDELEKTLDPNNGAAANLDTFIDTLNGRGPIIIEAHRNFLARARADQDWQRLLFRELTTDDLVMDGIVSFSNDVKCDLTNPIDGIFGRDRWVDFSEKGYDRFLPRVMYNLNGERKDWDVTTNDELWEALQPALQLASKVLQSNPPGLNIIADMTNRRKLPEFQDNRVKKEGPGVPPRVPTYGVYGDEEGERYEQLVRLEELGFDWDQAISAVMQEYLRFDINSGYLYPHPFGDKEEGVVDGAKEHIDCTYGSTYHYGKGSQADPLGFVITLAAEIIWPLLMPQFTLCEKMVASYGVATTLLHEFAHAIIQAQFMITMNPHVVQFLAGRYGYDEEVIELLMSLGPDLWDLQNLHREPILFNHQGAEVGFDFELSLWGCIGWIINQNRYTRTARQIKNNPFALIAIPYPFRFHPAMEGFVQDAPVLGVKSFPVEDYGTPITVDWIAQFFSQKWWDGMFAAFGHEALKFRPGTTRMLKTTMIPEWIEEEDKIAAYGRSETHFLNLAISVFFENGYTLVAEYIIATIEQPLMPNMIARRWDEEIEHWNYDVLAPLEPSTERLDECMKTAVRLMAKINKMKAQLPEYHEAYMNEWKERVRRGEIVGGPGPLTAEQMLGRANTNWGRLVGKGGKLMKASLETYNYMIKDVAYLQRLVFDYFSMAPHRRAQVYSGLGSRDEGLLGQAYQRMERFRDIAQRFAQGFAGIMKVPDLAKIAHIWRFFMKIYSFCARRYGDLLIMIGENGEYDPNDIKWKQRFASVPSSRWQSRVDRLRILMQKEYLRMDGRIRELVDQCDTIVRLYPGSVGLIAPLSKGDTDMDNIARVMEQLSQVGKALPAEAVGPFDWTVPPPQPPPPANPQSGSQPQTPQVPQVPRTEPLKLKTFSRAVFGRPSPIEGTPPPRESPEAGSSNPFQNTRPDSPFQDLGPDMPNPYGPGGAIPTSDPNQTKFQRRPRVPGEFRAAPPFPNPYASTAITTADVLAWEETKNAANEFFVKQIGVGPGPQPYHTSELWREARPNSPPQPPPEGEEQPGLATQSEFNGQVDLDTPADFQFVPGADRRRQLQQERLQEIQEQELLLQQQQQQQQQQPQQQQQQQQQEGAKDAPFDEPLFNPGELELIKDSIWLAQDAPLENLESDPLFDELFEHIPTAEQGGGDSQGNQMEM